MSGEDAAFVVNQAKCACTNSVHAVRLTGRLSFPELLRRWRQPFTQLSCELEGHPLGGGMLKLEPREAKNVVLSPRFLASKSDLAAVREAVQTMRSWRHYG
jgi:hypothetical protein